MLILLEIWCVWMTRRAFKNCSKWTPVYPDLKIHLVLFLNLDYCLCQHEFKGYVRYIFAILFWKPKREYF